MEISEVRIRDDGTAEISFREQMNGGRLEYNGVDLGKCGDGEVIYTFEEMLFADST